MILKATCPLSLVAGRSLVAGLGDGSLIHYDVERGELIYEVPPLKGPHQGAAVQHLSWVEPGGDGDCIPKAPSEGRDKVRATGNKLGKEYGLKCG